VGIGIGPKRTIKTGEAPRSWGRGVFFFFLRVRVLEDGGATYGQAAITCRQLTD
jgi:hypothetical protein